MELDSKIHSAMNKSYSQSSTSYLLDDAMNLVMLHIESGYMLIILGLGSTPLLKLYQHPKTL